jgi:hypothetical protein
VVDGDARLTVDPGVAGTVQSYFLREFIDEIVRTGGAARAGSDPPPAREAVEQEFKDVALAAATGLFGGETPIAVELSPQLGEVRVAQVLEVVDAPADPRRQIALAVLRAAGHAEVAVGDVIEVPIFYTHSPGDRATIEQTRATLGAALPLPVHTTALWEALTAALNAALLRWFPAPAHPEGSLGALLASGGGWTRGLSARSGDYEVELAGAGFEFYRTRVTGGWVEYGFDTVIRRGGLEVFRGASSGASARLGDEDAPYAEALWCGDNDGNVHSWIGLAASESAPPEFAALQQIADRLAGGAMSGRDAQSLLVAAIRPPVADGLWAWMQAELPRLLLGTGYPARLGETTVRFEISEVYPPAVALGYFGYSAVRLVGHTDDPTMLPNPEGEPLPLGSAGPEALTLRGPDAAERAALADIVGVYREWLNLHLDHHVVNRGFSGIEGPNYLYSFDGHFPLVELLEQRVRWGPPGEPPVPPFDEAALARAAALVRATAAEGQHVLAAFTAEGWEIRLHDDVDGRPFGSYCGVSLIPPEGGEPAQVMMVDAWNPETRSVIDGDAFAFRRFNDWLRAAIVRGGLDAVRIFNNREEDDEEEEESSEQAVSLSEWLLFGLPDVGDRFLVDWRGQWHVVNSTFRIDGFAGIYGFTGEHVERLRTRDVECWRRFLREVIDPGFARTAGERPG